MYPPPEYRSEERLEEPDRSPATEVELRLRLYAGYLLITVFAIMLLADILDNFLLGDRYHIDPLFFGIIGTLLGLIFGRRLLMKEDEFRRPLGGPPLGGPPMYGPPSPPATGGPPGFPPRQVGPPQ